MKNALNKFCLALIGIVALCAAVFQVAEGTDSATAWLIFTICGASVGVTQAIEQATKRVVGSIDGLSGE